MHQTPVLLAATAWLAVAACGDTAADADGDGEVSMAEAADTMQSDGVRPQPGQYRVTMEVLEVDIPNAPAGIEDMMRQQMAGQSNEYCLTQDQVDEGFEEMARQSQAGDDCSFNRFNVDGGDIDAEMVCNAEGQGRMTMTMDGEGSPTRSTMEMTMRGEVPGMGEMNIRTRSTHERIGDCAG